MLVHSSFSVVGKAVITRSLTHTTTCSAFCFSLVQCFMSAAFSMLGKLGKLGGGLQLAGCPLSAGRHSHGHGREGVAAMCQVVVFLW